MSESKTSPQFWATVTIVVAIISCLGAVTSAIIAKIPVPTSPALTSTPILLIVTQTPFSVLASTTEVAIETPVSIPTEVIASLDWQSTNIKVEAGDTIVISYISGLWSECSPNGCPYQTPRGILFDGHDENYSLNYADNVISGCRHAGLIARISTAYPVCIGAGATIQALEAGILELRINDTRIDDNDGIVKMLVQVLK